MSCHPNARWITSRYGKGPPVPCVPISAASRTADGASWSGGETETLLKSNDLEAAAACSRCTDGSTGVGVAAIWAGAGRTNLILILEVIQWSLPSHQGPSTAPPSTHTRLTTQAMAAIGIRLRT